MLPSTRAFGIFLVLNLTAIDVDVKFLLVQLMAQSLQGSNLLSCSYEELNIIQPVFVCYVQRTVWVVLAYSENVNKRSTIRDCVVYLDTLTPVFELYVRLRERWHWAATHAWAYSCVVCRYGVSCLHSSYLAEMKRQLDLSSVAARLRGGLVLFVRREEILRSVGNAGISSDLHFTYNCVVYRCGVSCLHSSCLDEVERQLDLLFVATRLRGGLVLFVQVAVDEKGKKNGLVWAISCSPAIKNSSTQPQKDVAGVGFVLAERVLPSAGDRWKLVGSSWYAWQWQIERAEGWFSCWMLKKSTSRDVDVELFMEEHSLPDVESVSTCACVVFDCVVTLTRGVSMLRLDDWHVGGPQPVSRDVECDSILCVLLVVVSSRSPWSPFSTARVRRRGKTGRGPDASESVCSVHTCAVEPARFQFSQCAPEGVAYYATGSCVWYRLLWSLVSPVLVLLGCCDVVFRRWLCRHLSRRLEMPRHHSRLSLNHRTYAVVFVFPLGSVEFRLDHVFLVSMAHLPRCSRSMCVPLVVHLAVAWPGCFAVVSECLGCAGGTLCVPVARMDCVVFLCPAFFSQMVVWCAEGCRRVVSDSVGFVGVVRMCVTTLVGGCGVVVFGFAVCFLLGVPSKDYLVCASACALKPVEESLVIHLVTVRSIGFLVLGHVLLTLRPTEARGELVVHMAVADRAGIELWGGFFSMTAEGWFSCWMLKKSTSRDVDVDLFREECAPEGVAYYATGSCVLYRLCSCAAFEAVEPCLSGAGLAWLLVYIYLYVLLRHSFLTLLSFSSWVSGSGFGLLVEYR
ncbi:hypothetical protein Taro_039434 [Colocasia esculenta]|uniref:Uncharacterized protein n=1 Tax=Colocasia esculenta TaxID=4460 RepID=A0A843WIV9_COLES|nr:hypothetical protein [Colocasia esculenta]